jgi:hypothetical protein
VLPVVSETIVRVMPLPLRPDQALLPPHVRPASTRLGRLSEAVGQLFDRGVGSPLESDVPSPSSSSLGQSSRALVRRVLIGDGRSSVGARNVVVRDGDVEPRGRSWAAVGRGRGCWAGVVVAVDGGRRGQVLSVRVGGRHRGRKERRGREADV